eukprot:GILK01009993.1.p1 GENE.GILK01009993.1~~GILK01009993.1.p1  ORF type:complete len:265 (+),score=14.89 GILK01009993.1:45-797(+)
METSVLRGDLRERLLGGDDEGFDDAYNMSTERTRLISSDHTLPLRTASQTHSGVSTSGSAASRPPEVRALPSASTAPASLSSPYPAAPRPVFPTISIPGLSNFLPAVGTSFIPMSIIVCAGCRLGLQFSPGAYCVQCPRCGTVTAAQHLCILSCVSCRQQVMYPAGAPQVRCACGVVNEASTSIPPSNNSPFPASNHQRNGSAPGSAPVHSPPPLPLPHTPASAMVAAQPRPDFSRGSTGIDGHHDPTRL